MPYIDIQFQSPLNTSCQVGDSVWSTNVVSQDQNNVFLHGVMGNITLVGTVFSMLNPTGLDPSIPLIGITVEYSGANPTIGNNDFLIFSKNKAVNTSGMKGYYARVKFENDSKTAAELFSVGTQIQLSSK